MTNQQYTPTVDELRRVYALKVPHDQRDRRNAEFDRFLSAAEQRGAEEGWDLAIDYARDDSSIYEADAKRAKAANPYRADQMEGFNDSHSANAA